MINSDGRSTWPPAGSPDRRIVDVSTRALCVLQVIGGLGYGGVQRSTYEMARYTVRQGWRSIVASNGGPQEDLIESVGAEICRLSSIRFRPVAILRNAFILRRVVLERGVDILHARTRPGAWSAAIASWLTGVPMVTTFHAVFGTRGPGKLAYNAGLLRGRKVIAVSKFVLQHIMTVYSPPADKVVLVERCFDPERFAPDLIAPERRLALRESWGASNDMPVIMLAGRLSRWKGQDDFVEALGRIAALPWLAVLVGGSRGSGKYERDLKSRVEELGLGGRIVFLPATDEMALHFAAADLVVYPASRPEGFGRIGVEAQAMGRPIVATGHGGSLETIRDGETGWLVPPKDPERLATAIADALSDRQRLARMGAAARAWVERAFPIERMCGGELAVYLDTLDAARGAAP